MGGNKYEKSFDNRCAALVSRERCAPRGERDRKPGMVNGLQLASLLTGARRASVARGSKPQRKHVRSSGAERGSI